MEGIFQDPSTFHLYLKVEPLRYMRIVDVKLASFTGGEHERDAPTWLKSLRALDASSVSATRSYNWLYKFCCKLFCSPGTTVSKLSAWVTIMNTVNRMKVITSLPCTRVNAFIVSTARGRYSRMETCRVGAPGWGCRASCLSASASYSG